MNGHERISAALSGEKTDKIPVMLHNFMMAAREHGVTMEHYRNDPKLIAECFMASVDKYKYDGILVDIDTVTLAGAVQKKTLELLSAYRHSNRFILNAGCALPSTTPSENLKMMIDTARNFR